MNMQNYMLKLFPLIVGQMKGELDDKCWLRLPTGKYLSFRRIFNISQEEKQDFIYQLVLINGFINSPTLHCIEYKRQGSRFNLSFDIVIPFETEQEKEEYYKFRDCILNVNISSRLLDEVFTWIFIFWI